MIDLDDTSNCASASSCAVCHAGEALEVHTATTPVGVICLTLCPSCAAAGRLPHFGMAQAVTMSFEHCRHLGITADEMGAAMEPTDHTVRNYGTETAPGSGAML